MILLQRKYLDETGGTPSVQLLERCITLHRQQMTRLQRLWNYYNGDHDITHRKLADNIPNNKIVSNHAKYITDMAVGYVFGEPIRYSSESDDKSVDALNDLFTRQDEDSHNSELANDISIFGYGIELVYMSDSDKTEPYLACLSPLNSFVVCDTNTENTPFLAVRYVPVINLSGTKEGWDVDVWTETEHMLFHTPDIESTQGKMSLIEDPAPHFFAGLPVIEYKNNSYETGDFESVLSLIDAYNLLMSDRVNDKEAFVDSILVVAGMSFGDSSKEAAETVKLLREMRYLEIPTDGSAQWLSKTLSEADTEILKKTLKDDIHEFSKVPCLTDENFAANASGVAMKYKLLGFEQLAQIKERYFKKGLRERFRLMDGVYGIKNSGTTYQMIDITMKRSLPVDDELKARIAQETEGFLSWETRLNEYDTELDPDAERERLVQEKTEAAEIQQKAFGGYTFPEQPQDEETEGDE